MQADTLAGAAAPARHGAGRDLGGSGGARVSLLTAAQHPDVAAGLAVWWISGGVYGLMSLGMHYCGQNLVQAWNGGMEAVVALPEWAEVLDAQPVEPAAHPRPGPARVHRDHGALDAGVLPVRRRAGSRAADADARASTCRRWCSAAARATPPHPRDVGAGRGDAAERRLVEPPWGDREWIERSADNRVTGKLFDRWPLLVPVLAEWSGDVFG